MILIICVVVIVVLCIFFTKIELFQVEKSKIQGVGLFTGKNYKPNEELLLAITNNHTVTNLCKKVNHCNHPNSTLKRKYDGWYLYSIKHINKGEEITADYNNTPSFIKKPDISWKC